jgi:hypothetical protein
LAFVIQQKPGDVSLAGQLYNAANWRYGNGLKTLDLVCLAEAKRDFTANNDVCGERQNASVIDAIFGNRAYLMKDHETIAFDSSIAAIKEMFGTRSKKAKELLALRDVSKAPPSRRRGSTLHSRLSYIPVSSGRKYMNVLFIIFYIYQWSPYFGDQW